MALLYNNIATTYQKQKKLKEALKLQLKAIHIRKKLNDVRGLIMSLNNIGSLYTGLKNYSFAEARLLECRTLCYQISYWDALSQCYSNLTEVADIFGRTKMAKVYADSALLLAKKSNYMEMIYQSSEKSYGIEKKLGNYRSALELLELNVKMGDSIKSQSIRKELYKKQYDYELKQKEELFVEREARKEVELKRQRLIRYVFTGGFVIAVLLALFIFKSLQTNRKKSKIISEQKEKVEIQKELIEQKQKKL
ncbi:MAG: tetratricopeptide repeat protein [Sphingobacteriaceae bacterium]|nr:tetratricopeptide repeat protein [Sphingobacteriaceae bacterium]